MGNWDGSKPNNDGERELIDRAVKALEAELATKTCNKQIVSKLENAELARDSEKTCNNKQVTSKLVASKDAISRQAAIDAIGKDVMGGLNYAGILTRLPSVTPMQRTGHWIETADEYYKAVNEYGGGVNEDTPYFVDDIACSVCLAMFSTIDNETERFNYCPNCGRRMVEPQESEVKG